MKRQHCEWADEGCTGEDGTCKCPCCEPVAIVAEGTTRDGKDDWSIAVFRPVKTVRLAMFQVGVQTFRLVETQLEEGEDPKEAEQHCVFIGRMFAQALRRIGVIYEQKA